MREIKTEDITSVVAALCIQANIHLNRDIEEQFEKALTREQDTLSRDVLEKLLENAQVARQENIPICQDTGMTVVFVELGQDAHVMGNLEQAIHDGVAEGYEKGFLRKSVVRDPIDRVNTKDNTPAVIHYKIVPGDQLKIIVAPKGFGSENMSRMAMLKPSDGYQGVKNFVLETVKIAGPNPCPPIIVGVGVGGTMEKAALMAKEALLRPIGQKNSDPFWAKAEEEWLLAINELGIGPAGFGGITTGLAVHINTYATHIAGLPVAVNIGCHVTRHSEAVL